MLTIEQQLMAENDWRVAELAVLKTIPFRRSLDTYERLIFQKYAVPAICALWEGFVVESFTIYSKEINNLNLLRTQVCINLLVYSIDCRFKLKDGRVEPDTQKDFVLNLCTFLDSQFNLPSRVSAKSNANYKVISRLLGDFNLPQLPENPYKKGLDKLLSYRNMIAHGVGQNSIKVEQEEIHEFTRLVEDLMIDTIIIMDDGFNNQSYLASP